MAFLFLQNVYTVVTKRDFYVMFTFVKKVLWRLTFCDDYVMNILRFDIILL